MNATDDRSILRDLAARIRDIADHPSMNQRRALWKQHNALAGQRPLILCSPEGAWEELLPATAMRCADSWHRVIEHQLRHKLYWAEHINDDNTLEPFFDLHWRIKWGDYGVEIPRTFGDKRGSFVWDPPIKDLAKDLDRLHPRKFEVDRPGTLRDAQRINELFGDLLPVRIRGALWWSMGLTQDAAYLVGLENLMWAMMDQPECVHRLMAILRDDAIGLVEWAQAQDLLSDNTGAADYVGSGGIGCIDGLRRRDQPITLDQTWGFAESQETVGISPDMFQEFVLPYQLPLLEKFGLNCYGCCEGLELRIDSILKQVPRLRRVSVAPNANQEILAEKLAGRAIFSRKPYPAHVCVGFNESAIREDLRHTLRLAGRQPLEIILKDTHTVENDHHRIRRWVQIAREEVDRYLWRATS